MGDHSFMVIIKKMKRNLFKSILFLSFALVSCTNNNQDNSNNNTVEETPDSYIDTTLTNTSGGAILQAFCWKHEDVERLLPNIKEAGYKTVQISPVQQPKNSASWWAFYQPLSFSIGESSLGNKETLTSLCREAEKYGISIIVDTVFNHMANISDSDLEDDGTPKVSPSVEQYEPEIYANRNSSDPNKQTFHHNKNATGSGAVTQVYSYGQLPDLNTSNSLVQERALSFLKECIDVGVDGFRFDAVKHIETPTDPSYASDFWTNTVERAKTYYKEKNNSDLFVYGELLNDVDGGRKFSDYTTFMSITDNTYTSSIYNGLLKKDGSIIENAKYGKNGVEASKLVTWVESHDIFTDGISANSNMNFRRIFQDYAVIASRKDLTPLYLARTNDAITVGEVNSYDFEDERIAVLNRFHNRFLNAEETQHSKDSVYYIERYEENQKGIVIVSGNKDDYGKEVALDFTNIGTGVYYDQLTNEKFTIYDNKGTIKIGEDGVTVLTMSKDHLYPDVSISSRGGSFVDRKTLTLEYKNVTSGYYQINGGDKKELGNTIEIGDEVDSNNNVNIYIYIENSNGLSKERNLKFTKLSFLEGYESYFHIFNINSSYLTDYSLYYWAWSGSSSGKWLSEYTVKDGVLLIDFSSSNYTNFLLARFEKNHTISNVNAWDNACLSQTSDLTISDKFYNAEGW